jgi:hypothetical protein
MSVKGSVNTYRIPGDDLHLVNDVSLLIGRKDVWDIPGVEDHANVLHEGLTLDLVVGK